MHIRHSPYHVHVSCDIIGIQTFCMFQPYFWTCFKKLGKSSSLMYSYILIQYRITLLRILLTINMGSQQKRKLNPLRSIFIIMMVQFICMCNIIVYYDIILHFFPYYFAFCAAVKHCQIKSTIVKTLESIKISSKLTNK